MGASESVFAFGAIAVVCMAWAVLVYFIPWCLCSQFRYRLWALRDALVSDIRHRRVENSQAMVDLLARVESFIRNSANLTFTRAFAYLSIPDEVVHQLRAKREGLVAALSEPDRVAYEHYFKRLRRSVSKHLLFGSPSGWCIFIVGSMGAVVTGCWSRTFSLKQVREYVFAKAWSVAEKITKLFEKPADEQKVPLSSFA